MASSAQFAAVPTNDEQVRLELRRIGEPITLFGEDRADRRARLIALRTAQAAGEELLPDAPSPNGEADAAEEEFYTEGSDALLAARQAIARYSLPRAQARIAAQKRESTIPLRTHIKHRKALKERLQQFELWGSQLAGERPVGIARFAPNSELIAAGNWAGGIKLLDVPNLNDTKTLRGHKDRVGGIAWRPGATLSAANVEPGALNLASGGGEGSVNLWSLEQDTPLATLEGHSDRVCRVEFHPSGKYLASASYDTTWRLWDLETSTELQLQEGHSRGVFAVSFNSDGSLLASAGLDSFGRIWDLRSGRTVMIIEGHIREIYALDWGVDGYRVLSGSGDGFVKCWDLRNVRNSGGVGAHKSVVSDLRWFKGTYGIAQDFDMEQDAGEVTPKKAGTFFVSSGFDNNVNVFSMDDWALVKTLSGHSGNVLSTDISADGKWILSSGHDRTVKLWGMEDGGSV